MGIFDIFKKKPELNLEELLMKASTEPAYRSEFYKRLLSDELIVITQNSGIPVGNQTLEENTNVKILTFPNGEIPVFTSTDRIFDKQIVKEEVEYIQMKGKNLFELAIGATFILNPYSDYGKELLPNEIESLLKGTILTDTSKTITIQKDTNVQIGQPQNYPSEIIESLKKLFEQKPSIKAAYLGWIHNPETNEPPHYIFGIDATQNYNEIVQEAGFTAKQYLDKNEFVDFIKIEKNNGLSDYFINQTKPFYMKK